MGMKIATGVVLFLFVYLMALAVLRAASKTDPVTLRLNEIGARPADETARAAAKKPKQLHFRFIRVPETVRKSIQESGLDLQVEEFVLAWILITCLPSALVYFFTRDLLISFVLIAALSLVPPVYINMKRKKKQETFENQLGDVLMLLSNSLRSGFSFEQSFEVAAKDSKDPLSGEFLRAIREMNMGVSLEQALNGIVERTGSTNMKLVTSAVLVQRQVGGNLADILDGISNTIRERTAVKKNVQTLTAQGRVSGLIIGALPVVLFFLISAVNPGYMSVFTTTTVGKLALGACVLFELVGAVIIKNMVNIEM